MCVTVYSVYCHCGIRQPVATKLFTLYANDFVICYYIYIVFLNTGICDQKFRPKVKQNYYFMERNWCKNEVVIK